MTNNELPARSTACARRLHAACFDSTTDDRAGCPCVCHRDFTDVARAHDYWDDLGRELDASNDGALGRPHSLIARDYRLAGEAALNHPDRAAWLAFLKEA